MYGKAKRVSKKCAYEQRKWTYLDVVTALCRNEISEKAAELSGAHRGSPAYLGAYHNARSQVEKSLSRKTRQEYRAMAKKWSKNKLPPDMQRRYAHGNYPSRLKLTDSSH